MWLEGVQPGRLATEGEGTWSPFDVLGHLIHGERTDWMPRARHILAGDARPFEPFDRHAMFAESRGKGLSELLEGAGVETAWPQDEGASCPGNGRVSLMGRDDILSVLTAHRADLGGFGVQWSLSTRLPSQMWEIARRTIRTIDPSLEPDIYVIALPHEAGDEARDYPLSWGTGVTCEVPMLTAGIRVRAKKLEIDYWRHPDRHLLNKRRRSSSVAVRSECLRKTIQQIIDVKAKAISSARVQFCGEVAEFEKFDIIPIIELNRAVYDAYFKLKRLPPLHARMRRSFVDALVEILLESMSAEISSTGTNPILPKPTEPLRVPAAVSQDANDYLRAAGRWFMDMLLVGKSGLPTTGLFEHCDAVSSQPYEGRVAHGRILLTRPDNSRIDYCVRWHGPVSLADHRWVRKLLEMSSDEMGLISDANHAHGLGTTRNYRATYEDVFVIEFNGHHRWSLLHTGNELMRVVDGAPQALRPPLDAADFEAWLLAAIRARPINVGAVWQLVEAAVKQKHGTMLVIRQDAAQEAQRLANQSTLIAPKIITPNVLERISGIDGGILIDPLGRCYAIGVILDGLATTRGNPSRGARYNSALRYVDSSTGSKARGGKTAGHCAVVVVSSDGYVDLVCATRNSKSGKSPLPES